MYHHQHPSTPKRRQSGDNLPPSMVFASPPPSSPASLLLHSSPPSNLGSGRGTDPSSPPINTNSLNPLRPWQQHASSTTPLPLRLLELTPEPQQQHFLTPPEQQQQQQQQQQSKCGGGLAVLNANNSGGKRGRPRADLINHLILEGSSSPSEIKCRVCNRVFPREKSLQAHLRTHTGEKPYVCDYPNCSRGFTQSGQLKTHQRLHAGEKPFACSAPGCNNRYTHANRTCPAHPYHKPQRTADIVLQPVLAGNENCEEVQKWLENYKRERMEKTPGKVNVNVDFNGLQSPPKQMMLHIEELEEEVQRPPSKPKSKRGLSSELEQENRPSIKVHQEPTSTTTASTTTTSSSSSTLLPLLPRSPLRPMMTRQPTSPINIHRGTPEKRHKSLLEQRLILSPKRKAALRPPKKRWQLEAAFQEQQQQHHQNNHQGREVLARPIQWGDEEDERAKTRIVARTLVELSQDGGSKQHHPSDLQPRLQASTPAAAGEEQPLNLSLTSLRS